MLRVHEDYMKDFWGSGTKQKKKHFDLKHPIIKLEKKMSQQIPEREQKHH